MKRSLIPLALLSLLAAGSASAQTTVTGTPAAPDAKSSAQSGGQEAVTRPNTDKPDATQPGTARAAANAKLEEGANSFTEAQTSTADGSRLQGRQGARQGRQGHLAGRGDAQRQAGQGRRRLQGQRRRAVVAAPPRVPSRQQEVPHGPADLTALYDDYDAASTAVTRLEAAGIPNGDISIVSSNEGDRHAGRLRTTTEVGATDHAARAPRPGAREPGRPWARCSGGRPGSSPGSASWPFRASARWWRRAGSWPP